MKNKSYFLKFASALIAWGMTFAVPASAETNRYEKLDSSTIRKLAKEQPEVLLQHLNVDDPDMRIVDALALSRTKKAEGLFEKIIERTPSYERRERTRLWLAVLREQKPPQKYAKATPEETLKSYAEFLRSKAGSMTKIEDDEHEFWAYPGFYEEEWRKFKERSFKKKGKREKWVADILAGSEALQSGSTKFEERPYGDFEGVALFVKDEQVACMVKGVFGQWRFSPCW